jgi:hypothetical protein
MAGSSLNLPSARQSAKNCSVVTISLPELHSVSGQPALAKEYSQIDACGPQAGLQAARNLKGVHGGHWRSKQDSGLRGLLQFQHGLSHV